MFKYRPFYQFCFSVTKNQYVTSRSVVLLRTVDNIRPSYSVYQTTRNYAKGKDKRKEDKGKGRKKNVQVNESALGEVINVEKLKLGFQHNIEKLKETFVTSLSLRTALGSIDNLKVKIDGKKYPLMELSQITRKNPKTLIVNMETYPQAIPHVLKAISESGMNLNPQQDGTSIYVPVPNVTREHREALSKNAKAHFIKCRDGIRDVQNTFLKSIKLKEKEGLPSDTSFELSEQVKFLADSYINTAEALLEEKQKELLY